MPLLRFAVHCGILFIAASLLAGSPGLAGELPRTPQPGLSYLEKIWLPEAPPDLAALPAVPLGDSLPADPDPVAALAGSSFRWNTKSPPDGRANHSAVYDPVQDRLIIFGGRRRDGGIRYFNDTWQLDLTGTPKWSPVYASGTPPEIRVGHWAVYDPVGNRMLVWGGEDDRTDNPPLTDLWSLSLSPTPTWTKLHPSNSPPSGRFWPAAVYDPRGQRIVFFGGLPDDNTASSEVWELKLSPSLAWHQMAPSNAGPAGRYWHSVVLDEARNRLLVYGGTDGANAFDDVWSLELTDPPVWEQLAPAGPDPGPHYAHGAAFDPVRDRMLVSCGVSGTGYLNETWALDFDLEPHWEQLAPADDGPSWRGSPTATFIPDRNSVLLFGGQLQSYSYMNDSWFFDLAPGLDAWAPAVTGNEPSSLASWSGRNGHAAVFDASRNRMLIYGGDAVGALGDVWSLSLSDLDGPPVWTYIDTSWPVPTSREGPVAALDEQGDRMIIFGGAKDGISPVRNDCWQLSFATSPARWQQLTFSGPTPVARWYAAATFDPGRRWMIVFGGDTKSQYLNDTWILDLHDPPTWTQLILTGTLPSPRASAALAFDEEHDRVLLYAGEGSSWTYHNDVWSLSMAQPTHWELLEAGGSSQSKPGASFGMPALYDTLNDRMLIYGGSRGETDLWSFSDHTGPGTWTQQVAPRGPLEYRFRPTGIYDPARGAMILYGGIAGYGSTATNSVWVLRWDMPVPVRITFVSVRRDDDAVQLNWSTDDSNPGTFFVDRQLPGQVRERVSDALSPVGATCSFRDPSTPPAGTRYYLELLDRAGGTTSFGPYELEDEPGVLGAGAQLTATPNPFRSGVTLTARGLPAGELVIEVCTVTGRVVHREPALVGFAGGDAAFQIAGLDALPAGMYFTRVRVGTQAVSTKLVKLE